jgi:dipeptidase E
MKPKRIFLTSSVACVAKDIAKRLGGAKGKKLLFVYTAAELKERHAKWLNDDRRALEKSGFKVIEYTITGKTLETIKKDFNHADILYFGGGNSFYLLEKIQQAGCAKLIVDLVNQGKIYIGTSAGSIVAGPDIFPVYRSDRAKDAPRLKGYKGLGLVDFVILPHWGSKHFKSRYLEQRLKDNYNCKNKLILLNDYQYIEVADDWMKFREVEHK